VFPEAEHMAMDVVVGYEVRMPAWDFYSPEGPDASIRHVFTAYETIGMSVSINEADSPRTNQVSTHVNELGSEDADYTSEATLLAYGDYESPYSCYITINHGDPYTASRDVTLTIHGCHDESSVSGIRLCNDNAYCLDPEERQYSTSVSWRLSDGDGQKTVYVRFVDAAGNESLPVWDTITLADTEAPSTPTVSIDGGATRTTSVNVTLSISSVGASQMMASNYADFREASWGSYSLSMPWTLLSGDGIKTVYVKTRNVADNESGTGSDTITLDTPPVGDIDRDGDVDFTDFFLFVRAFACSRGEVCYKTLADLDGGGSVDLADFILFVRYYSGDRAKLVALASDLLGISPYPRLYQNVPNPFNAITTIGYDLPEECDVRLTIHMLTCQRVSTLMNARQGVGHYEVTWDEGRLANGIYFCRLQAGSFVETKRMLLLK
jgi:hypothetical protein